MSKSGLPLSVKMRHDSHYVDALATQSRSIGKTIPIDFVEPNPEQPRREFGGGERRGRRPLEELDRRVVPAALAQRLDELGVAVGRRGRRRQQRRRGDERRGAQPPLRRRRRRSTGMLRLKS